MRVAFGILTWTILALGVPARAQAAPGAVAEPAPAAAASAPEPAPAARPEPAPAAASAPEPAPAARPEPAPAAGPESAPSAGESGPEAARTPSKAADETASPPPKKKSLSHRRQLGVEMGIGAGYSFLITYRDTTWCGQLDGGDNATFCSGMHPVHLDFGLSYGVIDRLDVLAEVRLGLMDDPTNNRPLMLFAGLRVWIDADQPFKIGVGFQLVVDLTKQSSTEQRIYGPPVKGETVDFGGRFFAQFQYDFLRYLGLYAKLDATLTARRWLQVNVGGQLGLQTRFP